MRGAERSGRALWITGSAMLVLYMVLALIDLRIRDTGGSGIIAFEFEFTSENARDTLAKWGEAGRSDAKLSLWLDYPFLIAYAAFFSLAVTKLCAVLDWRRWEFLALFPLAAAMCDAVENAGLLMTIGQEGAQPWPLIGGVFASVKFLLLTPVQLFVLAGFAVWLIRRVRRR